MHGDYKFAHACTLRRSPLLFQPFIHHRLPSFSSIIKDGTCANPYCGAQESRLQARRRRQCRRSLTSGNKKRQPSSPKREKKAACLPRSSD
ncbi:hypothetical protein B8V81_4643 [Paenibacillus pasadenensis]|uniref:Uncharacterized protein n=1 Tax=Paenibacillus pasadenensis TaxID=217090 RepID=A0A2N5N798_9BACL|nr:hypothetical protein B8V81_4643 [Paenibacillus pasadenensis]